MKFPKFKIPWFSRPKTKNRLTAGFLRSTDVPARAHDHFERAAMDIPTSLIISEAERSRLRSWCKKEYLDNPYARNMARSFALGVYGSGPTLQVMTSNEITNQRLEKIFNRWRKKVKLDWKLHVALEALFYDGEAFFSFFINPSIPGGFDVELIEARRIHNPYGVGNRSNQLDGITYNIYNEPISYSVAVEPINPIFGAMPEYREIPSEMMVHFFIDDVVNQHRGLPMLQSVLQTLASLQRIGEASLLAWESAASQNLVIQTGMDSWDFMRCMPEGYDPENTDEAAGITAFKTLPMPKNGMTFLASGMTMSQVKSEHPTSQFRDNKMTYLTEIGAGVGLPRNVVTADSSDYNYSSAQMDYQMFYRWGAVVQSKLSEVLQKMFIVAISTSDDPVALESLRHIDVEDIELSWHFPTILESIDRTNNSSADCQMVQNGLLTRKEYCNRYGIDYNAHMKSLQEEKAPSEEVLSGSGIKSGFHAPNSSILGSRQFLRRARSGLGKPRSS